MNDSYYVVTIMQDREEIADSVEDESYDDTTWPDESNDKNCGTLKAEFTTDEEATAAAEKHVNSLHDVFLGEEQILYRAVVFLVSLNGKLTVVKEIK